MPGFLPALPLASFKKISLLINLQVEVGKLVEVLLYSPFEGKRTSKGLCGFWGERNWFEFWILLQRGKGRPRNWPGLEKGHVTKQKKNAFTDGILVKT